MNSVDFRQVLSRFATGVTVVTAKHQDLVFGMTVNSFTSVSLEPPLVLFCSYPQGRTLELVRASQRFAVNILNSQQGSLCMRFAGLDGFADERRFEGVPFQLGEHSGAPLLPDCLGWVECGTEQLIPAGDHVIVIGQVLNLMLGEQADPLLFFAGTYPRLGG